MEILLTPQSAVTANVRHQQHWNIRAASVSIGEVVLVNLYTPTLRSERELFFTDLLSSNLDPFATILAGDFNCVQSPLIDRCGHSRANRSESPALDAVIDTTGLADARVLRDHVNDSDSDDFEDHFTYWAGERASRIDRFYVPATWAGSFQWVETRISSNPSDHQEVVLCLRNPCRPRRRARHCPMMYPIKSSHPDLVITELVEHGRHDHWSGCHYSDLGYGGGRM